jgi:virginiamycin B lyase
VGVIVAISLGLLVASPSLTQATEALNPVQIREWEDPNQGHTRDPFAVSADEIWFVGQGGNYLSRFTPSTTTFFKRDLPDSPGPHNLIVGSDGIVWYAGNRRGYIGRYDVKADAIEKISMPNRQAYDPHTLVFDKSQRNIWFTVQNGNFIGRLNIASRKVDLIAVPTDGARPYGIRMAPDGRPWTVLLGTNKIAVIDPIKLSMREFSLPARGARPRRLEITRDGRIWYADYRRGFLGLYDPARKTFGEWALPSGSDSQPYGMASDKLGRVWLVETGVSPNLFVGFDTATGKIISVTPIPSGAGSVRHMDYHAASHTVWFGTDNDTLGRATLPAD